MASFSLLSDQVRSLGQFFDSQTPNGATLMSSLSWPYTIVPEEPVLEIFGEIQFKEHPPPSPDQEFPEEDILGLLDLGSCSDGDDDDDSSAGRGFLGRRKKETCGRGGCLRCSSRVRSWSRGEFLPPPLSSMGSAYQSIKKDGRFVMKEIKNPCQECLHATREDGRLLLHLGVSEEDGVGGGDGGDEGEKEEGKLGRGEEKKTEEV